MKNPLASKTILGILTVFLPLLLQRFGLKLDDAAMQQLAEDATLFIGTGLAIYGRFKAEVPLKNPLASDKLPLLILLSAFSFQLSACSALREKWDGLAPGTQTALEQAAKAGAKLAIQLGLAELGDNVKELRPYTQRLQPLFSATFGAPVADPAALGKSLASHVQLVVPPEHQDTVRAALRDALARNAGATASDANAERGTRNAEREQFNTALAAQL